MHDVIIENIGEDGQLAQGWVRIRGESAVAHKAAMIDAGLKALSELAPGSARAREIKQWISKLDASPHIPVGEYKLRGQASMFITSATQDNLLRAHQASRWASAGSATRRVSATSSKSTATPASAAAAVAKARAALKR